MCVNGFIQEGEELMLGHVYLFVIKEKKKHGYACEKGVHFNFNLLSFPSMHRMNNSPK